MTTVYNKPLSRFEAFTRLYVRSAMDSHKDNPAWSSYQSALEHCGGSDAIYDIWCLFSQLTIEAQKRVMGFTDYAVDAVVEQSRTNPLIMLNDEREEV